VSKTNSTPVNAVERHYTSSDLASRILDALKANGKDIDRLTPDDLAAVDEFHTRGRASTVDLARLLDLKATDTVLDLGSGLGGPARYLARTIGCRVTGIDLTRAFADAANELSKNVGMQDAVSFRQGDALDIPFPDATFDFVWSQNVAMNIAGRARLYAGIHRVLKPGGRYGFTDIVTGPGGAPLYPQPWARDAAISHLRSAQETWALIEAAGLIVTALVDQSEDALARTEARIAQEANPKVSAAGLHLILGDQWPAIQQNSLRNYRERRIGFIQGVAVRPFDDAGLGKAE
jgi:SAM-dependent methyltransferase